jgi:hypothetical protein
MGILDFFMFRVPISTAKWVAKHFNRLHVPGDDLSITFKKLIDFRYSIISPGDSKVRLEKRAADLDNLTDFTHAIMWAEGIDLSHLDFIDRRRITGKISETLKKHGIEDLFIFGNPL